MRSRGFLAAIALVALFLSGCSKNDAIPKLVPVQQFEKQEFKQDVTSNDFLAPRVDILMVIDGSGSMGVHIANVEANIDKFIEELATAKLDYRIAITIAGYTRQASHIHLYPDLRATSNSGLFHTNDPKDTPPYFVTSRTPNVVDVLKSRVRVGTGNDALETFFGPVLNAIEHAKATPANLGFFREEAYLIPLFIMDAEDQTKVALKPIDTFEFYQELIRFKGKAELIIPYAVLIPTVYGNNPPCTRGGEAPPFRMEEFIRIAGGAAYDLCSPNFGVQLADIGNDLAKRVSGSFVLDAVPNPTTIVVYLGDKILPNDPDKGWTYNPDTNSIQLGRDIEPTSDPEATFRVEFVPANVFHK